MAGANAVCRGFRCCHPNENGEIDTTVTDPAGPFSSRNCDMSLSGAKVLLIKLKEALVAENSNYIAAMVIVSGNVVSD